MKNTHGGARESDKAICAPDWSPKRKNCGNYGIFDDLVEQRLCELYINNEYTEKEWDMLCYKACNP
jgi:hypothetical protein